MKKIIILIFCCIVSGMVTAQPNRHHVRYSVKDGLPQHIVMDIMQDQRGFMWVATWNGLCKFDGYEFVTYLSDPYNGYYIRNNRIDHLAEDRYGYIWILSYDGVAHRFDPESEVFTGMQKIPGFEDLSFHVTRICTMPSGKVWLMSDKSGCICVTDSTLDTELYHIENKRLKGETVYLIHEDQQGKTWLLTDNGIAMIPPGNTEPVIFFPEDYHAPLRFRQSFHSIMELDHEIWFGSNNGRIWKYSKKDGQFVLFKLDSSSDIIQMEHTGDRVIIASSYDGLFVTDRITGETVRYHTSNTPRLDNHIYSIATDHMDNVWIATSQAGATKLDLHTGKAKHFESEEQDPNQYYHPSMFIIEDSARRVWVHPRGGGFSYYDPIKDTLVPLYGQSASSAGFSGVLHAACCDRQGNLWLSSRTHGLEKIIFENNQFRVTRFDQEKEIGMGNDVRALFEDSSNNRWISTKDGTVRVYDDGNNFIGYLCRDGRIGNGESIRGIVYCMSQDRDGNIWVGTKGDGIYRLQPRKAYEYDITNYMNDPDNIYSLSNNNVYAIVQDSRDNIWIGTYGGGINLVERSDTGIRFIHHRNHLTNYPIDAASRVRCISEDHRGKIYVGTTIGLIVFDSGFGRLPESIVYRYYSHIAVNDGSLNNNDVQDICIAEGDIYLATFGGGINKVNTWDEDGFPLTFKAYTRKNGLPSNVTLSIVDSKDGTLWVSMENYLSRFDPAKEVFETFGEIGRLIGDGIFSEGSSVRLQSDEMLFGFSKGILSFSPRQIANNTFVPAIALTKFRLFNKDIDIGESAPLQKQIDYTGQITLTHKQNFFSIGYAALDFRDPDNILYAYKLEGFDNEWVYAQKQRIANYTNLPKGRYVFCVKSTNSDGVWVGNERRLPVVVLPSFWDTPWAYALYCLVFVLMLVAGAYILHTIYQLKHKVELETQLSEMKIRFFTDISHEIRTPLTMITAPVDYLVHDRNTPPDIRKQLDFVSKNTQRMLRMVNQVLDLRKIQHLKLNVEEIRLDEFIDNVCKGFHEIAEKQRINFRINQTGHVMVWADRDCLEKIIFNLLSNAFKYTPQEKNITVNVSQNIKTVYISVRDEGKGIPKEKQNQIFTRFVAFNDDRSKPSTGIGLSLVKELVDRHHATISVESTPEKGSCFTVCFQRGYTHFGKNVNLIAPEHIGDIIDITEQPGNGNLKTEEQDTGHSRPSILIVEDDDQLRLFLRNILEDNYKLYEATDGEAGYRKAMETIPDFIVSDVMMPRKDGLQMLQQLKKSINTSHIPVVLLTAKTAIESKLEGLEYGADDYITKPFSVPYFRARIENLLKQRKQLQQLYCSNLFAEQNTFTPRQPQISSHDKEFMDKVVQDIENNMDNSDYSIDILAASTGVSRTVLLRKIKGLTGFTPIEFIRDIRLQRAAQLLASKQLSVKEVVYMIGMTDTRYFRECFKKKFGKSPSEYHP